MSRDGRDHERFARGLMESRSAAAVAGYPHLVYSYSSRAVADLPAFVAGTRSRNPYPLLSLYDVHHHLGYESLCGAVAGGMGRVFDSGNYEVGVTNDSWTIAAPPGERAWDPTVYVETARAVVQSGDTLVSFDLFDASLEEQVEQAATLFERIGVVGVRRDLLLHPNGAAPSEVAAIVARHVDGIDLLGVTEKDLGLPWYVGATYLRELREALTERIERYVPIHVFGCLDPRTVPLLFFAGADVFDGLAWSRYYFRGGHAYYAREFEHDVAIGTLTDWETSALALAVHNIEELEAMRTELQYTVLSSDMAGFESNIEALERIWEGGHNGG